MLVIDWVRTECRLEGERKEIDCRWRTGEDLRVAFVSGVDKKDTIKLTAQIHHFAFDAKSQGTLLPSAHRARKPQCTCWALVSQDKAFTV